MNKVIDNIERRIRRKFQWPNIRLHQIYDTVFSVIDGKYWFITVYIVI